MSPEIVLLPVLFALIGFVVWVVLRAWQRRQQLKLMSEFQGRILDRVGSMQDLSDFLGSEGGAKLMDALADGRDAMGLRERVLGALQAGVVLVSLGLGFLFVSWRFAFDDRAAFGVVGILAESLGVGFLLSAGVTYWAARQWALSDPGDRSGGRGRDDG